jgi:hypothetical protein
MNHFLQTLMQRKKREMTKLKKMRKIPTGLIYGLYV